MNKRIFAIILTLAMLLSLVAGCGTSATTTAATTTAATTKAATTAATTAAATTAATTTAAATTAAAKLKVALVVNQKFGDNGPMDDMAAGLARAEKDFGITTKKLESASAANFEADVRAMAKAGYDLIITTFPYMSDATKLIAKEYPKTKFSAIFQFINVGGAKIDNIWDTEFHGEAAFYLAGYMAAKFSKTAKIGMQIGSEELSTNAEGNGFMRGVKAANPNANVEFSFVGSYEDPAKAKEIGKAMIAKGVDFIQNDSGATNAGAVEAAKAAGIMVAGEITDFYSTTKDFAGIVGIGFGNTVYSSVQMAVQNKFPVGEHGIRGLENGGYFMDWASYERFAKENTKYGGAAATTAITEAKALEKKIMDGSLKIAFDSKTPNWATIKAEK